MLILLCAVGMLALSIRCEIMYIFLLCVFYFQFIEDTSWHIWFRKYSHSARAVHGFILESRHMNEKNGVFVDIFFCFKICAIHCNKLCHRLEHLVPREFFYITQSVWHIVYGLMLFWMRHGLLFKFYLVELLHFFITWQNFVCLLIRWNK